MQYRVRLMAVGGLLTVAACARLCPSGGEPSATADSDTQYGETYVGTLAAVRAAGQLRVLTWSRSKGALPRAGTPLSFERDLATQLAADLGVELVLVEPPRFVDLLGWLEQGRGDLVVASLTPIAKRQRQAAFTRPLRHVRKVLIGPKGAEPLADVSALAGKKVVVFPQSSAHQLLSELKKKVPTLEIEEAEEGLETLDLVEAVATGELPFTVIDSKLAEVATGYLPDIELLLELSEPQPQAWAVHLKAPTLRSRINAFLARAALTTHRQERYTATLEEIQRRKVLRVLTRNNGITYWLKRGHEVGFEYELARAFATKLGVRLEMVIPPARRDLIPWLLEGRGDLIAAMLTNTSARQEQVAFGPPYVTSREVVVTRRGGPTIAAPEDLAGQRVHVRRSSSYYRTLTELSARLPTPIEVVPVEEWLETEEALRRVATGSYGITVADINVAAVEARYEPRLVVGPALTEERPLGWAVRREAPQLAAAVTRFFTEGDYRPRGLHYNILHKRYLVVDRQQDAPRELGDGALRAISPYDNLIKRYAATYKLDWRLIAAQMYQESRFDPGALSPVGALGLMQVMPATARGLSVGDVRLPEPGIHAGVKYMRQLLSRFDPQLAYRQRYRFALASYNAGRGHVEDARRLAAELKLDPNRWFGNTEKAMLLLEKSQYARRARFGYCRGREPVNYVSSIQTRFEAYSTFARE